MRQNLARRMMVYVCGLLFLSCGVVMNARTGLGVAPISTVPYVMYAIEGLSLGTASFAVYCVFVVAQLCMVRYPDVKILMQIPVTLLFGALIDVLNIWLFPFTATGLVDGLIMLVLAVSFTTLGYGDLVLPQDWRLLGGMCGANGFMIFGFVIAMLVEALRHVRLGQIEGRRRK